MSGERPPSNTILVVAAALIDARGRALLHQRRPGGRHGGLWEFPGGKVETGETPAGALVREIDEELGIALDPAALVPAGFACDAENDPTRRDPHLVLLYGCGSWQAEPRCLAGAAIGWFAPADVAALPLVPLDRPLAASLARIAAEAAESPDE